MTDVKSGCLNKVYPCSPTSLPREVTRWCAGPRGGLVGELCVLSLSSVRVVLSVGCGCVSSGVPVPTARFELEMRVHSDSLFPLPCI